MSNGMSNPDTYFSCEKCKADECLVLHTLIYLAAVTYIVAIFDGETLSLLGLLAKIKV